MLARAWSRFKEPAYLTAAQQALGIFQTPPSAGRARSRRAAGALYAEYTYAPCDRILNGFIQALVGLYDYTSITKDPLGLKLFEAGDAEARAEVPHYDTGAWSLYDQFGESNLNYHELLTEFLQHLCERTRKGPPLTSAPPPAPAAHADDADHADDPRRAAGSARLPRRSPRAPPAHSAATVPAAPIAGDQIYCTTAQRFTDRPAHPAGRSRCSRRRLRGGTRAGVQMSLSKISTVTLTVRQGDARGVDEQRHRRTRPAQAAVDHAGQRRHVHRHAHRDRPRRATSRPPRGTIVVKHH